MKVVVETKAIEFAFDKYVKYMLKVASINDFSGIQEIKFKDTFSHPKSDPDSLACYLRGGNGNTSTIEVNVKNILKENKISEYIFNRHPEIAALWLSDIVFHEIGHHAHHFKRHGIKHKCFESFAGKYAQAGYYNYLISRKERIISSYKWGAKNILELNKDGRETFKHNLKEILSWLEENKKGINYPKSKNK
jgi:hypothetical protein